MKIYANEITEKEIFDAALQAGVDVERLRVRSSRRYVRSFDVILSGSGARRSQYAERITPAATWDEWGIFLARLFDHEPGIKAGPYQDRDHFRWSTDERYDDLRPAGQHKIHKWVFIEPGEHGCSGCDAVRRFETRRAA